MKHTPEGKPVNRALFDLAIELCAPDDMGLNVLTFGTSERAVRNGIYRLANLFEVPLSGNFDELVITVRAECRARGYGQRAPYYMAEGEYEVPRFQAVQPRQ